MRRTLHSDCMTLTTRCLRDITPSSSWRPASVQDWCRAKWLDNRGFDHDNKDKKLGSQRSCIGTPWKKTPRYTYDDVYVHSRGGPTQRGGACPVARLECPRPPLYPRAGFSTSRGIPA